jgi:hypothetical protein
MSFRNQTKSKSVMWLAALCFSLVSYGCGGGYGSSTGSGGDGGGNGGGGGGNSISTMQGQWEIVFHSEVSPTSYSVLEANLTQTGTHVFAGAPSALVYQSDGMAGSSLSFSVAHLGGQCDSNGSDEVTFDATLSNVTATDETLDFTLTEQGNLGTAVTTSQVSTNAKQVSGNYSTPAACGSAEDHGTFQGYKATSNFSPLEHYHGNFNGGTDAIVISFTSDSAGFGVTASGTDNGSPFTLAGSTVGQSLSLTGTVSGHAVSWFGVYDSTYNIFQFYDSSAKFLGTLNPS